VCRWDVWQKQRISARLQNAKKKLACVSRVSMGKIQRPDDELSHFRGDGPITGCCGTAMSTIRASENSLFMNTGRHLAESHFLSLSYVYTCIQKCSCDAARLDLGPMNTPSAADERAAESKSRTDRRIALLHTLSHAAILIPQIPVRKIPCSLAATVREPTYAQTRFVPIDRRFR